MNGMSAPPSREAAWARAFRARLDEVAALGGERGRPDLGRAPSRLWLMEPDELERLPIRDFIAAFEVPRGLCRVAGPPVRRRVVAAAGPTCAGAIRSTHLPRWPCRRGHRASGRHRARRFPTHGEECGGGFRSEQGPQPRP
jgi:hypothetical protein